MKASNKFFSIRDHQFKQRRHRDIIRRESEQSIYYDDEMITSLIKPDQKEFDKLVIELVREELGLEGSRFQEIGKV